MHSLVRRFIKTGIAFLFVGLALGVWMIGEREIAGRFPSPWLVSAHTHAILVGFVMMMILGVALWLFPRPEKDDARYDPNLVALSYWLLAAGTALRVAGEVAHVWVDVPALRLAVLLAGVAQALGIGVFFVTMWSRIRPVGSHLRERKGERF